MLAFMAWRVAVAPAILIGSDPQWEYAVDERVRIGRARSIANLACAQGFVLIVLAQPTLPQAYALFGTVAVVGRLCGIRRLARGEPDSAAPPDSPGVTL